MKFIKWIKEQWCDSKTMVFVILSLLYIVGYYLCKLILYLYREFYTIIEAIYYLGCGVWRAVSMVSLLLWSWIRTQNTTETVLLICIGYLCGLFIWTFLKSLAEAYDDSDNMYQD